MRVLFVCTGNICRSPTAHGMLVHMLNEAGISDVVVESAGVASAHIGEPPDKRTQIAAQALGYNLSAQRARNVVPEDFDRFDLILAMDHGHLAALERRKHNTSTAKLKLFLDYAPEFGEEVPDPYYGGAQGFTDVAGMIEIACKRLLAELRSTKR